jgi:predicted DNA-binding protein
MTELRKRSRSAPDDLIEGSWESFSTRFPPDLHSFLASLNPVERNNFVRSAVSQLMKRPRRGVGRFGYEDQGKQTSAPGSKTFSVRFPLELSEFLDKLAPEKRSDFIRDAVRERMAVEAIEGCPPMKGLGKTYSVRFPPDLAAFLETVDAAAFIRAATAEKKASL